ncbi:MAG: C10 family peptidase, partial [Prevotella sp.]|nr:C10 family peptidase [Prevotella sp.]
MRRTTILLFCLLTVTSIFARQISKQEAYEKAQRFMQSRHSAHGTNQSRRSNQSQSSGRLKAQSNQPTQSFKNLYVFNVESNGGFVIVSADDRTTDILGYADRGAIDTKRMPCNMQWLLSCYDETIARLSSSNTAAARRDIAKIGEAKANIMPFVNTQWGQYEPYNSLCPMHEDGRCLTGCVATALAQITNYYRWPQAETAAVPGYTTSSHGFQMPELPPMQFDWNNLDNNGKAQLMLYCGQAVQMDYGPWGSGAYNYMALQALTDVFGYNKEGSFVGRNQYSDDQWTQMLYDELKQGHPVMYFGQSPTDGGHAFIVDGYLNGLYHINWGWDGYCDGYFAIDALNPDMADGFNYSQEMIINACPPEEAGDYTPPTAPAVTYFPRKIVMEEATGTWCGYCPYGMAAIEYMNKQYPDNFIAIAIHDDDDMPSPESYWPFLSMVDGFPTSRINRSYWYYPNPFNLDGIKDLGVAMIKANAAFTTDNQVEVSTETTFGFTDNSTEYRIAYIVVEDNVGPYNQANYMSKPSAADNPNDYMNWWVHQGPSVETTFNHVARAIYNYDGVAGLLPMAVTEGEAYPSKYTLTLPDNIQNVKNVQIVTLLIDTNTGEIINADRTTISGEFKEPTYFPRKIVMEEATGTWCGYCPYGIAAIESMKEQYPDNFIAIAIHGEDEMTPTESYNPFLSMVNEYPTSHINRSYWYYPQPFNLNGMKDKGIAMIKAGAEFTAGNQVEINTETTFGFSNNGSTEYRIAYVVVEDNVGPYQQANYLSNPSAADNPNDLMNWWVHQGTSVETIYNDVARTIYDYDGIANQLPRTITEGETYKCSYTLTLPNNIKDAGNVKIVTLLLDTSTGEIINADRTTIAGSYEVVVAEINEANFPDKNFRDYLLAQEYGKDGKLTETEINGITKIDVSGKSISSLKGIENFVALNILWCYDNQLTTLDITQNAALTELRCYNNQLTTLNVSQ